MDKYDKAIDYLTQHPEEIYDAWEKPTRHNAGALFLYCGKDPTRTLVGEVCFGCLTQVKGGDTYNNPVIAETPELTKAIKADERIPESPKYVDNLEVRSANCTIKLEHLPVFAEWQRRLDKELNRV